MYKCFSYGGVTTLLLTLFRLGVEQMFETHDVFITDCLKVKIEKSPDVGEPFFDILNF